LTYYQYRCKLNQDNVWGTKGGLSLFEGIYELHDAGRLLYVTAPEKLPHYSTIHRWVRSGLPSEEAKLLPKRDLFISFLDLISLRMIVSLRLAGFSLQHIRGVQKYLQELTKFERPFATKDLWVSKTDIFIEMDGLLSASKRGQLAMEYIRDWLARIKRPDIGDLDIEFDKLGGVEVATKWTPSPSIVLDPTVQFGAPCLKNTRIPTESIWLMKGGGDSPQSICESYKLPMYQVQTALEWEEKIAATAN
jgi:uncharacterized protein (DUF433 family)